MEPFELEGYKLNRRIGIGATSEVFYATDKNGNERAVKLILPHIAASPDFINMFIDEINIIKNLDHPHIVGFFESGTHNGRLYIVLEWVDGLSLAASLEALPPLSYFAAFAILEASLKGLCYAHSAKTAEGNPLNIVHRDICPENLLIARNGIVKIADFGIAYAKQRIALTMTGEIKGRFEYMPPEQAKGGAVDGRSDLYALGKTITRLTSENAPASFKTFLKRLCEGNIDSRPEDAESALEELYKISPHPSYQVGLSEISKWMQKAQQMNAEFKGTSTPLLVKK